MRWVPLSLWSERGSRRELGMDMSNFTYFEASGRSNQSIAWEGGEGKGKKRRKERDNERGREGGKRKKGKEKGRREEREREVEKEGEKGRKRERGREEKGREGVREGGNWKQEGKIKHNALLAVS